jgi:hypothetical protein
LMDFSFRARGGGCCTAAGRKSSEGRDPNAFCVRPLLADPDRNNPDPDRSTPREHRAGDAPGDSFDFLAGLSLASVFSLSSDLAVVFLSVTFSFRFASWDATFGEMRQKSRHKEMPSSIFSLFLSRARTLLKVQLRQTKRSGEAPVVALPLRVPFSRQLSFHGRFASPPSPDFGQCAHPR